MPQKSELTDWALKPGLAFTDSPIYHGDFKSIIDHLEVEPVSALQYKVPAMFEKGPRMKMDNMWFLIVHGRGWCTIGKDKTRYPFKKGDLFFIPRHKMHKIKMDYAKPSIHIAVHFNCRVKGGVDLFDILDVENPIFARSIRLFFQSSKRLCCEYIKKAPGWQMAMKGEILTILFQLFRYYGDQFQITKYDKIKTDFAKIAPAISFISNHLGDSSLSVEKVAKRLRVSEVYLRKLFREVVSLSPIQYIQQQRVERARTYLRNSQLSIQEICDRSGFIYVTYFHRAFKKWTGKTPAEYRESPDE